MKMEEPTGGEECYDVIVVGGGVMGSSTAYQIAKRGLRVVLLEQFDLLHHRGSSHGESRTIRATYPEPYYSSMVLESSELWEEAEAEIGYKVYFKSSQLDMGPANNSSLKAVIRNNPNSCRVLGPSQVLEEFSGRIEIPDDWVGVLTDLGGVIKPTKAVSMFQALALKNGAILRDNTEVEAIERDRTPRGGVVVIAKNGGGGRFWGRKCVLTVGSWMKKMAEKIGINDIPIRPLETSVLYWRIKEEEANSRDSFTVSSGFPTFASYGAPYVYGTPSLEFPGLIKIPIHGGITCDPDTRTWSHPSKAVLDSLKKWIDETFRGRIDTSLGPVMTQSCVYSMTPDEDYIIDFLGGEFGDEVAVAGGFSGHGFKMAPVVGRILADLVLSGEAKGVDLSYFKLARFQRNPKGNVKDFDDQVGNFFS